MVDFKTKVYYEENNKINSGNLNKIMSDLIYHNYNIFLYGFGSKIRLIYNFIDENSLEECCNEIYDFYNYNATHNLQAIRRKFSSVKFGEVAKIKLC